MSKGLPVIQNFDALLTLLNEPDKVKGYLNEIRAYRDEIKLSLDIAKTVDQARQVANDAVTKRAAADQYDITVRAAAKDIEAKAAALLNSAKAESAKLTAERAVLQESSESLQRDTTARTAALDARELELVKREKMLAGGQGLLAKRTADLDVREERLRKLVERNKAELGA